MKNKKIETNILERLSIVACLLLVGFKNVIFGCLFLPILGEKIGYSFITQFIALGILAESLLVTYYVLKIMGAMD